MVIMNGKTKKECLRHDKRAGSAKMRMAAVTFVAAFLFGGIYPVQANPLAEPMAEKIPTAVPNETVAQVSPEGAAAGTAITASPATAIIIAMAAAAAIILFVKYGKGAKKTRAKKAR
jgi:hypothetical protein